MQKEKQAPLTPLQEAAQILANGIIRMKSGTIDTDKPISSAEQPKTFC
jgi:hypothetical protein